MTSTGTKKLIRYFTLVEILIALALIIIAAGVVGFQSKRWVEEQQALTQMERLVDLIALGQEAMLFSHIDVVVQLAVQEGVLTAQLQPKSSLDASMKALLVDRPLQLPSLNISFEDGISKDIMGPPFELSFLSQGFVMNRGLLRLKGGGAERTVVFIGYPAPFFLQNKAVSFPHREYLTDLLERAAAQATQEAQK